MTNVPYDHILSLLQRVRRRYFAFGAATAVLAALTAFAALFMLFGLFETFAWLSPRVRTALFLFLFAVSLALPAILFILTLLRRPDRDELARMVERRWPQLHDRLVSAVQLGRLDERGLRGQSAELVEALVRSVDREIGALPIEKAVPGRRLVFLARAAAGAIILSLLLPVVFPRVTAGYIRLADHSRSYLRPGGIFIITARGSGSIIRGEDFITPGVLSGSAGPLKLYYRWEDANAWNSRPVEVSPRNGGFTLTVEKPRRSFSWYLEAGSHATKRYAVTIIERPVIERLTLTLRHPAYTGLGTVVRNDSDGNIRALRGTEALLEASVNKPLREMALHWSDSTITPCAVAGNGGKVSFRIEKDIDYHIGLTDALGIGDINPIVYRITSLEDEKPLVSIISPASDVALPRSMRFPILYQAGDDYGLSRVALVVKLPQEEESRAIILKKGELPRELAEEYLWDLSALNVLPGDSFTYHLSVHDNDTVRGPKEGVSETYTVRVPSLT
ncbi:MAG: DUF4175 family protein, partial [Candidatus Latescibacterota bacterium]